MDRNLMRQGPENKDEVELTSKEFFSGIISVIYGRALSCNKIALLRADEDWLLFCNFSYIRYS